MDPQSTVSPTATSSNAPVAPIPPKSRLPMILISLVVLLLVGGGGIFLGTQIVKSPAPTASPIVVSPTAAVDPTTNWQVYSDHGFEFKYPASFKTVSCQNAQHCVIAFDEGVSANTPLGDNAAMTVSLDPHQFSLDYLKKSAPTGEEAFPPVSKVIGNNTFYYYGPGGGGVSYPDLYFININGQVLEFSFWGPYENDKTPSAAAKVQENQILSTFKFTTNSPSSVMLTSPTENQAVTSPLMVSGTVPTGWMFEGQLPIKLLDAERKLIAQETGKEVTPGSWQSGQPVKFTGSISFTTTAKSGYLVIANDNPSGLPENSKSYEIPVYFNCRPRPACLDSTPRCMIPETSDMCPKSP